jgi:diguanylate cyclase (GGDEF)-like protein/hemerythrin-like metal-binding protein/PAS domain S-box-containing protein
LRSALLGYAWSINRGYRPVRLWAMGSTVMAAGVMLISLRGIAPGFVSVVVGQAFVMLGWLYVSAGTIQAADRQPPWRWAIPVLGLALLGTYWFYAVSPNYGWRTLVTSAPGLAFDIYVAYVCFSYQGMSRRKTTLRLIAGLILFNALGGVFKNVHVLHSDIASPVDPSWEVQAFYIVSILTAIACTVLYVLLSAQKVQENLDLELEERKRANKSMQLANLLYQATSEGMIVTEADGTIIDVNPAFTALSGYSAEEVIGKNPRILKSDRQDAAFYQAMWQALGSNGRWAGEIWNRHKNGQLFAEHLTINTLYRPDGSAQRRVALFHDVTQQKLSAEKIYYQANHDRLTGLANRQFFFDRLANELSRARRAKTLVGLLFMDLDRFKPINDQYGHEAGDVVLQVVSQRWSSCIRSSDMLARIGGDEFALMVGALTSTEEAGAVAQKLVHMVGQPIELPSGQQCHVGVSVGIAVYPDNAMEMDSLIAASDAAMYACKAKRLGGFRYSAATVDPLSTHDDWIVLGETDRIGIAVIDGQHGQLINLVNGINRAVLAGKGDDDLKVLFNELITFATEHFETEHRLMVEHQFPGQEQHDAQHTQLADQLAEIFGRFEPGDEIRLLQTTKDWLMGHIQHADKPLGAYLLHKGVR